MAASNDPSEAELVRHAGGLIARTVSPWQQGLRLFDGLDARQVELEPVHVSQGPQATHLRYRVRR